MHLLLVLLVAISSLLTCQASQQVTCKKEEGWCTRSDGVDQESGVIQLTSKPLYTKIGKGQCTTSDKQVLSHFRGDADFANLEEDCQAYCDTTTGCLGFSYHGLASPRCQLYWTRPTSTSRPDGIPTSAKWHRSQSYASYRIAISDPDYYYYRDHTCYRKEEGVDGPDVKTEDGCIEKCSQTQNSRYTGCEFIASGLPKAGCYLHTEAIDHGSGVTPGYFCWVASKCTVNGCTRDPGWCNHQGSTYSFVDCDKDGVKDHVCEDLEGKKGIIHSKDGVCTPSTWPNALASQCPVKWGNEGRSIINGGSSCSDRCFYTVPKIECPDKPWDLPKCNLDLVKVGDLCESDGECNLPEADNCDIDGFDVHRRTDCFPASSTTLTLPPTNVNKLTLKPTKSPTVLPNECHYEEYAKDCAGNDMIDAGTGYSIKACSQVCTKESRCEGFSINNNGHCKLKYAACIAPGSGDGSWQFHKKGLCSTCNNLPYEEYTSTCSGMKNTEPPTLNAATTRFECVDELLTYNDAAMKAQNMGGQLMGIYSASKQAALENLPCVKNSEFVWIGGKRSDSSFILADRWKFSNDPIVWGTGASGAYTNWAPSEPNDAGGREDCMNVFGGSFHDSARWYRWNDGNCLNRYKSVVELPTLGDGHFYTTLEQCKKWCDGLAECKGIQYTEDNKFCHLEDTTCASPGNAVHGNLKFYKKPAKCTTFPPTAATNAPTMPPTPPPTAATTSPTESTTSPSKSPTIGTCRRDSGWCTHTGSSYSFADCDKNGEEDHVCEDNLGRKGIIFTKSGVCQPQTWPNAVESDCPAVWGKGYVPTPRPTLQNTFPSQSPPSSPPLNYDALGCKQKEAACQTTFASTSSSCTDVQHVLDCLNNAMILDACDNEDFKTDILRRMAPFNTYYNANCGLPVTGPPALIAPSVKPTARPSFNPSSQPPTSAQCIRPTNFCTFSGAVYKRMDCNGDGTLDHVCLGVNADAIQLGVVYSWNFGICSKSNWPAAKEWDCPKAFGIREVAEAISLFTSVIQPVSLDFVCNGNEYMSFCQKALDVKAFVDCNGDGIVDIACSNPSGQRGVIFSTKDKLGNQSCNSTVQSKWPTAVEADCPVVFKAPSNKCLKPPEWCTNAGNLYKKFDCDGNGAPDHVCVDTIAQMESNSFKYLIKYVKADGTCDDYTSKYNLCPALEKWWTIENKGYKSLIKNVSKSATFTTRPDAFMLSSNQILMSDKEYYVATGEVTSSGTSSLTFNKLGAVSTSASLTSSQLEQKTLEQQRLRQSTVNTNQAPSPATVQKTDGSAVPVLIVITILVLLIVGGLSYYFCYIKPKNNLDPDKVVENPKYFVDDGHGHKVYKGTHHAPHHAPQGHPQDPVHFANTAATPVNTVTPVQNIVVPIQPVDQNLMGVTPGAYPRSSDPEPVTKDDTYF